MRNIRIVHQLAPGGSTHEFAHRRYRRTSELDRNMCYRPARSTAEKRGRLSPHIGSFASPWNSRTRGLLRCCEADPTGGHEFEIASPIPEATFHTPIRLARSARAECFRLYGNAPTFGRSGWQHAQKPTPLGRQFQPRGGGWKRRTTVSACSAQDSPVPRDRHRSCLVCRSRANASCRYAFQCHGIRAATGCPAKASPQGHQAYCSANECPSPRQKIPPK